MPCDVICKARQKMMGLIFKPKLGPRLLGPPNLAAGMKYLFKCAQLRARPSRSGRAPSSFLGLTSNPVMK